MRLTILGSGCPVAHPERFGPGTLVDAGPGARILVDCGSGVTQRLVANGTPGRSLDGLLLTHLHSDHIIDLFQLVISSWHQGRDKPWLIYGPYGTRRYVDGLMSLWHSELEQRIAHERRPSTLGLKLEVTEIAAGTELQFNSLKVTVVAVRHQPVKHAFGFIFRTPEATLAISGDTTYCPELIQAAQGVDLLVHEVFIHRAMPMVPSIRTTETVSNVASYHTLETVVGKVASEAQAKILMLTHFVPPTFDRDALLEIVRQDYTGHIFVSEDGMTIDLVRRLVLWKEMRLILP
ncbi:MAG: MBL fold metallo-hydrolase [Gomphosphaeria aponina SAG 52.96 = DSM 107014]|uniref:MBL fold metallo-hydrolase n=1 Tax=Gomphosphaeria aponina SAG 52.96 = DSM 107014 TaxID=1521640 RepID=A0A941GWK6_9CHRO|nr:MBL fold metallo-hydrolase [Gomphosphaeria aponina SAG 52.96 = DSM 107014]